jgi:hypothetical protein
MMNIRQPLIQGMLLGAVIFALGTLFGVSLASLLGNYPRIAVETQLPIAALQSAMPTPPAVTPELTSTLTPEGPFAYLAYTPTPITPANLHSRPRQSGSAHIYGYILCKDAPAKSLPYLLMILAKGRYAILRSGYTYPTGYWYFENIGPGTYTLMADTPARSPDESIGVWQVEADQVMDFGEVVVEWPVCE